MTNNYMLRFFTNHDKFCSLPSFQSYLPLSQKRRERKQQRKKRSEIKLF